MPDSRYKNQRAPSATSGQHAQPAEQVHFTGAWQGQQTQFALTLRAAPHVVSRSPGISEKCTRQNAFEKYEE
ncbi:MAG: hypothetical protein BCS36_03770 [Desulfovibrio sp. MES5]|nr:MAG: hypothetical protein BCS36_03770 [Desulfovibrio sp. MES5]